VINHPSAKIKRTRECYDVAIFFDKSWLLVKRETESQSRHQTVLYSTGTLGCSRVPFFGVIAPIVIVTTSRHKPPSEPKNIDF
jgi:hypothetical protein